MQARIALAAAMVAIAFTTTACLGGRCCNRGGAATADSTPPAGGTVVVVQDTPGSKYDKPGYKTFEEDGRLWVFADGSKELQTFLDVGEPAKSITLIGEGPDGMSLRAADIEVARAYAALWPKRPAYRDVEQSAMYTRPGFAVFEEDGRLWVFKRGTADLTMFYTVGEPAKSVTLVGDGPNGKTIRGSSVEDLRSYIDAYRYGRPGFAVFGDDGRLWVFRVGSEAMDDYMAVGEPAKSVTLVGDGPDGKTVRAADISVARAFLSMN